jgi:transketolase
VISRPELGFAIGRAIVLEEPGDVLFVGTGVMTTRALDARARLAEHDIAAGVVHVHTVKPLDADTIIAAAQRARVVVTVEEHFRSGGLGTAVLEAFADRGIATPVVRCGFRDAYSYDFGSQDHVLSVAGLDAAALAETVASVLAASVALR